MQGRCLILFSSTLVQPSTECHSGLLFKSKSIGVGGSVPSICKEFVSNRSQSVVVVGAASEWIPIVSGAPQGIVFGPFLVILYISQMFELVENRL